MIAGALQELESKPNLKIEAYLGQMILKATSYYTSQQLTPSTKPQRQDSIWTTSMTQKKSWAESKKIAAQQAINVLQQYKGIHAIKLQEYKRRSTKRNWYGEWLPAIQQQDDQLEQALRLVKDTALRTPSFSI
ncbi:hypothetical protein ZIOFF_016198 [Zingiber officinale]|uniref:Uncharacterized protein n=1 Tax=Zingiber officinale TaxID=94328 RepID=A0A8J5LX50_ZINOF|nr:hypothetical protein ZIOFF_016198 [Zingiber officinale]